MIDVTRPSTPPPSLTAGKGYAGPDVLEALHATFLGKCYLCESLVEIGTFQVDHRRQKGDPRYAHLVHAWDNLFPTCAHYGCNQRRPRKEPEGGLLDPGDGVEARVAQRIEGTLAPSLLRSGSASLVFEAADPLDSPAANTAEELDHIHNAPGPYTVTRALRAAIFEHVTSIARDIYEYAMLAADPGADPAQVERQRRWVARLVSRHAPYTMLVRSYVVHIEAVRLLFD